MVSSFLQPQLNFELTERPILSVSQLSQQLKRLVESNFQKISVRGEISGLKYHTSGHAYFCIKDNDAVIDGVCWRGTPLGIRLEEGLEIVAHGRLTTYPGRSKYQIVVEQAEAAGEGALLKLLMERKARLEAEGLFSRKRPLPFFPKCIGVITSPTGAVIQDIIHRISDRFPCCHMIVWPVLVQGPGSVEQIAGAINGFNKIKTNKPDVLIVARGGGSLEDLWSFNEEIVVRATFNSEIPIISAIGHETDTTLIDFAADLRAPTPTAAAELATPILSQLILAIMNHGVQLKRTIINYIDHQRLKITSLGRGLPDAWSILEAAMIRLDDWQERLKKSILQILMQYRQQTNNVAGRILHPRHQLDMLQNQLNQITKRFEQACVKSYTAHDQTFNMLSMRLEQSSFQRVLERGFCWVAQNGEVIPSAKEFRSHPGKPITLHFYDDEVKIKAEETN